MEDLSKIDLNNLDLSKINVEDIEVVEEFIRHFNLPEAPTALTAIMNDMSKNRSDDNKRKFVKEVIAYLALNADEIVSIDNLFEPIKDAIIKVDNQFKEGDA